MSGSRRSSRSGGGGRGRQQQGRGRSRQQGQGRARQGGRAGVRDDRRTDGRPPPKRPNDLGGDQVEGRQAVRELLVAGRRRVHEVTAVSDIADSPSGAELIDLAGDRGVKVTFVSPRKLETVARTEAPQGVVARAARVEPVDLDDLARRDTPAGGPPLLLVLDGITDPGNLGAVLRSAEVMGVSGAVLPRHRAVRLTPAATKAAAGAIEHLPLAIVGGIPAALQRLSELGVWTVGLDGQADASLDDLRVADEAIAVVLGSEGFGLSSLVRRRCDQLVAIPQAGVTESLNVSAAGAVVLHEVARRRRVG